MYRRGAPLSRPAVLRPPSVRNSQDRTQYLVQEQTDNEDDCVTSSEMLLTEDFGQVLDLSQSSGVCKNAGTSQSSTQTEPDTSFQLSPDLFPAEDAPLEFTIISPPKRTASSSTKTSAGVNTNNEVKSMVLTPASRRLLSKLAPTKLTEPSVRLYECITQSGQDQMSSLCRMTATSLSYKWEMHKASTPGALDKMEAQGSTSVPHSKQEQVIAGVDWPIASDLTDPDIINGQNLVVGAAELDFLPLPSRSASPGTAVPSVSSSPQPLIVLCRGHKRLLDSPDAQRTLAVKAMSRDTTEQPLQFDDTPTILAENNNRTLLVNNIDIYKSIDLGPLGKYELRGVPFLYVIFTGIITSKLAAQKNMTELEVDDGTAVVKCLFDDTRCLQEHRNSFHTFLETWNHNLPLFRRDAEFDATFKFMREYGKRLCQETPQSDDLVMGDEVTIVGKVFDSTSEERVVYHKFLWRKVDLAFRESRDYLPEQFARPGRHF